MRKIILFAFAFSISSFAFSQTSNNQKLEKASRENNSGYCASCPKSKTTNKLPADFPKYINTGNKELDDANYDRAKQEWISNNPERYKNLFSKEEAQKTQEKQEKQKKEQNRTQINKN